MVDPFRIQKLWLRIVGVTFAGEIKKKWLRNLLDAYFSMNMLMALIWGFLYLRAAYLWPFKDFNNRVMGIEAATSVLPSVTKYVSIRIKEKEVKELLDSLGNFECTTKRGKIVIKAAGIFGMSIVFIILNACIFPLFLEEFQRSIPYYGEEKKGPFEEVLRDNLVTLYTSLVVVWGNGTGDTFFVLLTSQLCHKIYILKNTLICIGKPWDPSKKDVMDIPQSVTDEELMRICIKEHKRLLRLKKKIETVYRGVLFVQIVISMVDTTSALFMVVQVHDIEKELEVMAIVFPIFLALFMEIFFYCWGGEMVESHFEELYNAAYSSAWYTCSKEVKNSLIIFLAFAKKPVTITALVFHFNFSFYEKICKETFSLYTLMHQFFN